MAQAYKIGIIIHVDDLMQEDYTYELVAPMGKDFAPDFKPHFNPQEMLELGVFEGKYCNDCQDEFPQEWFKHAKISDIANEKLNYFGVKSRQPLSTWRKNGWILGPDPRGWFQWYCRYYMGRRIPLLDAQQIKRWRAFSRHAGQIKANCIPKDLTCRPRQRQALLQWAYDPFI